MLKPIKFSGFSELEKDELMKLDGGIIPFIAVVAAVASVAYGGGYAIGKAKAHYDNNKQKSLPSTPPSYFVCV